MSKSLRSIQSCYLYDMYNKTIKLDTKMLELYKNGIVVNDEINDSYIPNIQRRFKVPLKDSVVEDFKAGKLICIFDKSGAKVPGSIPVFLVNSGNGIKAVVNMSLHGSVNKEGELSISPNNAYVLMEAGAVHLKCFSNFNAVKNKAKLLLSGAESYSLLFTRSINKMFTLGISEARMDTVKFLSAYFFIHNMCGRDEESYGQMNTQYALKHTEAKYARVIEDTFSNFDVVADFENFDSFIRALRNNIPGLEKLYVREFINQWMISYGTNMLLALEYLPLFYFNMCAVSFGSYMNNEDAIQSIIGDSNLLTIIRELKDV